MITDLEGDPDDVPLSAVITLQHDDSGPLPADGKASQTFTAQIPEGASPRVVTFRTTAGTFVLSGSKEFKVRAEEEPTAPDHLVAHALLRADTLAGTAYVSASIGDFTAYDSVRFVPR